MSENEALVQVENNSDMSDMITSRQAQEVQAAIVIAKRFPRDEVAAHSRIMRACQRKRLAEVACYEYPRGGQKVEGPSIRLAEAMAQAWGNLDYGIIELDQRSGESTVMAYCWDLETNARQTKVFQVPHIRYSKKNGNEKLTDPRDIYEITANQGARRLRACILGIIPGDIQDDAVEACDKTLAGKNDQPVLDRVRKMVEAFEPLGVTQKDIEEKLQHPIASTTARELASLTKVYNSIKDGIGKKQDFFAVGDARQKPQRKSYAQQDKEPEQPKDEPQVTQEPETTDKDAVKESLIAEIHTLEELLSIKQAEKIYDAAGVDPSEMLEVLDIPKLKELKQLLAV